MEQTKKQTAVEWLVEHFKEYGYDFSHHEREIEQAKEIEKEQIIDANIAGQQFIGASQGHYKNDAEEYYNKIFKQD